MTQLSTLSVVRVLVERGAETQAKDKFGLQPGKKCNFRCFLPFIGPSYKDRKSKPSLLNAMLYITTRRFGSSPSFFSTSNDLNNTFPLPTYVVIAHILLGNSSVEEFHKYHHG